jgi:hypothetical protein
LEGNLLDASFVPEISTGPSMLVNPQQFGHSYLLSVDNAYPVINANPLVQGSGPQVSACILPSDITSIHYMVLSDFGMW